MRLGFKFYVEGLENAAVNLLRDGDAALGLQGLKALGVKEVATYSGELDKEDVAVALKSQVRRFPLVLFCYGSGIDKRKAAVNLLDDEPIEMEHRCSFVAIVVNKDLRGDEARRTGAVGIYSMIDAVQALLGGVTFDVDVTEGSVTRREPLNHQPFLPVQVETILHRPDMTAYSVPFETSFHYWLPDRRTVFAGNADEITLGIVPTDNPSGTNPINLIVPPASDDSPSLPGVHAK